MCQTVLCTEAPSPAVSTPPSVITELPTNVLDVTSSPTSSPSSANGALIDSLPVPIESQIATIVQWNFPRDCTIADLDVTLGIDHVEVGDLKIYLGTPTGGIVGLLDRPGTTEPDGFGFSSDLIAGFPITFDDASANDPEMLGATGTPQPPGSTVRSFGAFTLSDGTAFATLTLDDLIGSNANGVWLIGILDDVQFLDGSLETVELDFTCA